MTQTITTELQERMIAWFREAKEDPIFQSMGWGWARKASDIASELPKPVDPDLLIARKAVAGLEFNRHYSFEEIALAGIKAIRQEQGGKA